MILLLAMLSQDIPQKPEPSSPVEGQCEQAVGLEEPCGGVVLPTSIAADCLSIEIWSDQLSDQYTASFDSWKKREDFLLKELEGSRGRKWIHLLEGVAIGIGIASTVYFYGL